MKNTIFSYIISILCFGCCQQNKDLNYALRFAGENKSELVKVLRHYEKYGKNDQRYKAAVYLIENMPGHYSLDQDVVAKFIESISPIVESDDPKEEKYFKVEKIADRMSLDITFMDDLKNISSEYLIHNIDQAFDLWQKEIWAMHLNFDEFCEIILPYKVIDGKPLDYWKDSLYNKYDTHLEKYEFCPFNRFSSMEKILDLNEELRTNRNTYFDKKIPLLYTAGLVDKISFNTCEEYVYFTTALMRSKGLPLAYDFTPQWTNRSLGHSWNALLSNDGRIRDFVCIYDERFDIWHSPFDNKAKVYRHTYKKNKELIRDFSKEKYIPEIFRNIFIKDVTDQYVMTTDIHIKTDNEYKYHDTNIGYLSIFNNREWSPIAYGKKKGKSFVYKNVAKNNVFLPVVYTSKVPQQYNYPFQIDYNGEVTYLIPDTNKLFDYTFNRKFPVIKHTYRMGLRLKGAKIEASNKPDFSDAILVYEQKEWFSENAIKVDTLPPYRFWRFYSAEGGHVHVSEMKFMSLQDTTMTVKGEIIGTEGSIESNTKENMFDDNLLTYYNGWPQSGCWAGMDFGEPTRFSKIIYYPRTDGNNIELGDTYELFYMGRTGWVSISKQVATDIQITFQNIPSNGLYLLENISKGVEKRIFTIENNKQIWW